MKATRKFSLEVEVSVDGKEPSDEWLTEQITEAIYRDFPSFICDDEEMDCQVFVDSVELQKAPS